MNLKATRILALATALAAALAAPAQAQLGGLTKRLEKAVARKADTSAVSGAVRATATIEWTIETVTKGEGGCTNDASGSAERCRLGDVSFPPTAKADHNSASTPGTLTDHERGRVTFEFEMDDPNALPGGMISRMSGGPLYPVGVSSGAPLGAYHVARFSGSVELDRRARPVGACRRLGAEAGNLAGLWIDPVTLDATGKSEYAADRVLMMIHFKGEAPTGVEFGTGAALGKATGVPISGNGSFACGGHFAVRDTMSGAGIGLGFHDGENGWTVRTERIAGGYKLAARKEMADSAADGSPRTIVTNATLTWSAPSAPQAAGATGAMAPPPTLESATGTITFTQRGKQATWPLESVVNVNQAGVMSNTYMFTPDGGSPSNERGVLALAITSIMGRTMVALNLAKGPAGDSEFEAEDCTVQMKPPVGKTASGSGECKKGGVAVTFTFTAGK